MWGNLADRLGATDINATLEKIGNAVAPRDDEDDEYYDDDDISDGEYGDDDEYEEDYDDGNGDGKGIMNKVSGASPFRLAGMLTQALENRSTGKGNSEESDDNSYTEDNIATDSKMLFPTASAPIDNDVTNHVEENGTGDERLVDGTKGIVDVLQQSGTFVPDSSQLSEANACDSSGKQSKTPITRENAIGYNGTYEGNSIETSAKETTAPVETSTKSKLPATKTEKTETIGSIVRSDAVRENSTKIDQIPIANNSLRKNDRDAPKEVVEVDSSIVLEGERKDENETMDATNENTNIENARTLESTANIMLNVDATKGKNDIHSSIIIKATAPEPTLTELNETEISTSAPSSNEAPIHSVELTSDAKKLLEAESSCRELRRQLLEANQAVEALKVQARRDAEKAKSERDDLIAKFQSKEARLLQATSEENQNQTLLLEQEYTAKIQNLETTLANERKDSQQGHAEYKRLLRESLSNVDRMEKQLKTVVNKHDKEITQMQQREERALRKVDDRMAQTMAVLDERDEEIKRLKKAIKNMESKVNEHQEGEEEAEEELEEIHEENESLRQAIDKLKLEKRNLIDQVAELKSGSEELPGLQMELTMLREERSRERTKNQTLIESAMCSRTQLETERDNALAELRDLKQQLAATLGDLEISRTDYTRIVVANENLQSALEAFQEERRAEMEMLDEQRRESEEALKSAHATATGAMKQIHENEMYEVQKASDNAVENVMHEMELVEGNIEKLKSENDQMRRSLDEAIYRLQTTQEDVIDRDVMKNILLDWCTLNDQSKRHQVLQIMANLLHFSEEEKEKVHLTSKSLDSVRAKVVEALAAPLPPSKADVEHLEGSNVREKWVNFLMAETDDI